MADARQQQPDPRSEETSARQLQVRRVFQASPDRLFKAWTTPEELRRWHAPGPLTVALAEIDLRVGGRYRINMRTPEGVDHRVSGVYRIVDPPRKLVYTWQFEGDPIQTEVTLDFVPVGAGTELVLTHRGFHTDQACGNHEKGWLGIFAKLGASD